MKSPENNLKLLEKFLKQLKSSKIDNKQILKIEEIIQYRFKNQKLLEAALTHTSIKNEQTNFSVFERMEFLGDSVLGLIAAEELFSLYPTANEGTLAKLKSKLVSQKYLFVKANEINLGKYVLLSEEASHSGGRRSPSIITDTFEALICAIYLDRTYNDAAKFVKKFILNDVDNVMSMDKFKNYKSILQEATQSKLKKIPKYKVLCEEGLEHDKMFTISVSLNGELLGTGKGKNKKEAQQSAAKEGYKTFCGLKI
ncbi:MAG: ribonuclease III [Candidatus Cloacimonetes bacterium]|nr:ribonuclease III [Candidatus Cloacimonadota bacterium]